MTMRLYYTDSYAREFDARVIAVDHHEGRSAALLDRTAFYPASGGQPSDRGRLGDAAVVDVVDREDGSVLHVTDRPLAPGPVHGQVDWERRFDHMQQHTGQHLLSAAFDRLHGVRTDSFHLGSVSSTIDLARVVSASEIEEAEAEACRVIWEDRPITIRFASAADAAVLRLRKGPARDGELRLVEVEGFDVSACGGTHVARTGGVGIVAASGAERVRAGTRIEFVCGGRALRSFRALRNSIAASVRLMSVLPDDLPTAIERLQGEAKEARRQVKTAHDRLAAFEGAELSRRSTLHGDVRVVIDALEGWDPGGLKTIASTIAAAAGHVAILFSVPAPSAVVIARSADARFDSAAVLRRLVEQFGGKGGGRPELAQGGGLQGAPEALIAFARSLL